MGTLEGIKLNQGIFACVSRLSKGRVSLEIVKNAAKKLLKILGCQSESY